MVLDDEVEYVARPLLERRIRFDSEKTIEDVSEDPTKGLVGFLLSEKDCRLTLFYEFFLQAGYVPD